MYTSGSTINGCESQLERALLDHLQEFLLELGKGFCFVARQRRVTFDNEHSCSDLLLYNRRLKCLVAIDLMLGHFRHEYAGAMNFYLNYLKAEEMEADENPPIGIILCSEKNETHVEYALHDLQTGRVTHRAYPVIKLTQLYAYSCGCLVVANLLCSAHTWAARDAFRVMGY
jgi:hypothetical protein